MIAERDTIVALATPVGTAAIAVVRASGPACPTIARDLLGREPAPRQVTRCDYRTQAGLLLDDVLLTLFRGPRSYTGEDTLEISCHGNPLIAQKLVDDLLARGCRAAQPGEFTQRAFLNGRIDLTQAEAVMDLIHARSERALVAANQQLRGALGRRLSLLTEGVISVLAHVEAYIDFPEEDLPAEDRAGLASELQTLAAEARRLLATNRYGNLLREGIKTVILGQPNVGKSSLLNRLIGADRALVSPIPGTTRDFIEESISVGPHCLRLIDTAGLNPAPDPLEELGIKKTWERAAEADLFLLVLDATSENALIDNELRSLLQPGRALVVRNKMDLPGATPAREMEGLPVIDVSALTGAGVERLQAEIVALADAFQQEIGGEIIAINARHAQALTETQRSLDAAQAKLGTAGPVELLASDLRNALDALGQIAGRIDHERVLDQLFASFCIGK